MSKTAVELFIETLTPAEIEAATFLEWTDERLGQAVRATAAELGDRYGQDAQMFTAALSVLLSNMKNGGIKSAAFQIGGDAIRLEVSDAI